MYEKSDDKSTNVACMGIRHCLIIGGFGLSLGEKYRILLLNRVVESRLYEFDEKRIDSLITMLEQDDNHCIEGAGAYGISELSKKKRNENGRID